MLAPRIQVWSSKTTYSVKGTWKRHSTSGQNIKMGQITWKKSTRTSLVLTKTLAVTQRWEASDDGDEI